MRRNKNFALLLCIVFRIHLQRKFTKEPPIKLFICHRSHNRYSTQTNTHSLNQSDLTVIAIGKNIRLYIDGP